MSRRVDLQPDQRATLARLMANPKFELIPLKNALGQADHLPAGSMVTVTASPTKGLEATFDLAEELVARGHSVIPHLAARQVRDRAHLRALLGRVDASGINRLFVVGGDATTPGSYPDGFSLLREMDELGHSMDEIGIPGYPEGHAFIPDPILLQALIDKQPFASYVTTQMCFDPKAIIGWIGAMRAAGVTLPVHIGVPGVSDISKLARVAAMVGVGDSMRYLRKNTMLLGRLLRPGAYSADALLQRLVSQPNLEVEALHIFTFNQVETTEKWRRQLLSSLEATNEGRRP
jgi:methylenetetrahydrofolate reductase (NADPH)